MFPGGVFMLRYKGNHVIGVEIFRHGSVPAYRDLRIPKEKRMQEPSPIGRRIKRHPIAPGLAFRQKRPSRRGGGLLILEDCYFTNFKSSLHARAPQDSAI